MKTHEKNQLTTTQPRVQQIGDKDIDKQRKKKWKEPLYSEKKLGCD